MALLALAVCSPWPTRSAAQPAPPETLVMPFDSLGAPAPTAWIGEGAAHLVSAWMERYGAVAVPRDERTRAFERLQLPPAAALSHATVIKIGQFVGAAEVIIGSYAVAGETLTVRARRIRLDEGRLLPEVVESGPVDQIIAVFERLARALRGGPAAGPPPAEGTLLASPRAFESYVKALLADTPATERALLDQAARAAPNDDHIRLALWHALTQAGDHLRAHDVANLVPRGSPQRRAARYLAALSLLELKRFDAAVAALKEVQAEARSAEALNALGVVELRRGATGGISGGAPYYFSQASQTMPADPDYCFNLGYAHWLGKDAAAAVYWLREAVRRDPTDGEAHFVLAAALQQTGATAEAARERELAARLSGTDSAPKAGAAEAVPRGLERLKGSLGQRTARVDATLLSSGQRDQAALAAFHLEAGRRAFAREADREADQELRRALYLSPYLAEAHLLLGRIHLRGGRPHDAIQAFKIAIWSEDSAPGRVALAEAYVQIQNVPAATAEVERALAIDPAYQPALQLRITLAASKPGAA